jgi:PHD/YefM family antitoxin component YafN of YafNO toxin-antitoxin module
MIELHPNYLEKNGKKEFAILPYEEFMRMQEELADYEDLRILRDAKEIEADSPTVPFDDVKKELGLK